jgi:CBS domain-containing protein
MANDPPYDPLEEQDEAYFEAAEGRTDRKRAFDVRLLEEPVSVLPSRHALVLPGKATVTDAVRLMQKEHRGAVLITETGTERSRVIGIFTERDVLFRIVDGGRNPATLPLEQVMTAVPDCVTEEATLADLLHMMSVGGFRHVPVVTDAGWPVAVVAVRDIVELLVSSFPQEILNRAADRQSEREGG